MKIVVTSWFVLTWKGIEPNIENNEFVIEAISCDVHNVMNIELALEHIEVK